MQRGTLFGILVPAYIIGPVQRDVKKHPFRLGYLGFMAMHEWPIGEDDGSHLSHVSHGCGRL
jgi:hypothetical protein